jgi:hypothetical protein
VHGLGTSRSWEVGDSIEQKAKHAQEHQKLVNRIHTLEEALPLPAMIGFDTTPGSQASDPTCVSGTRLCIPPVSVCHECIAAETDSTKAEDIIRLESEEATINAIGRNIANIKGMITD